MRVSNATLQTPVDRPDLNGTVYTKETISNAVKNMKDDVPIIFRR